MSVFRNGEDTRILAGETQSLTDALRDSGCGAVFARVCDEYAQIPNVCCRIGVDHEFSHGSPPRAVIGRADGRSSTRTLIGLRLILDMLMLNQRGAIGP